MRFNNKPGFFILRHGVFFCLLAALPLAFMAIFYFYPLFKIIILSFTGKWAGENQGGILVHAGYFLRILRFTTWQAALSTLLTVFLALPGAWIFAKYDFKGKTFLKSIITIPFVLPTVVVAAAFESLLGPGGIINQWLMSWFHMDFPPISIDRTIWFILLAHVFYNYTIVFRLAAGFFAAMQKDITDAAMMLGASPKAVFFKITLPLLRPVLFAASSLVFIFCFSSFGVILILGGPEFSTVEVEIYRQTVNYFNLPLGATLSLIQIGFTFCVMWIYTALQKKTSVFLTPGAGAANPAPVKTLGEKFIVGSWSCFVTVFMGFPLLALILKSLVTDNGFSPAYYLALFSGDDSSVFFIPPLSAITNSLNFALATLVMGIFLGTLAATFLSAAKKGITSFLDPVFMLPLSTSAVTLGFGFIIALDRPPLNLRTSPVLIPFAHALVAFPFVLRTILPVLRSIPQSLRDAAAVLGASPFRVWKSVDFPLCAKSIMAGAVFAFTISMGEFGATLFVARPETSTMPLVIYRFLEHPGSMNYGQAMAMSCMLMIVTAAGFLLLEKFKGGRGEF